MNQRDDSNDQRDRQRDGQAGGKWPDPAWAGHARLCFRAKPERGCDSAPAIGFDLELILGPQFRHG